MICCHRLFNIFLLPGLFLVSLAGHAQTYDSLCNFAPENQPVSADSLKKLLTQNVSGKQRVGMLLRLGGYYVYKSGEFRADLDSARTLAQQARQLSRKLSYPTGETISLNLLGTISKEARQFLQAATYQQQAIALSKSRRDALRMADSYRLLSEAWRSKEDHQAARKAAKTALVLYTRNGYQQQAAEAYLEMGNTYANWGEELNGKIRHYQRGLQGFVKVNNVRRQADVHKDLGDLFQLQENQMQALVHLRRALILYRSIHFSELQGVYDLLGSVYVQLDDYQQGLNYGLLAVKTAETLRDTTLQLCTIYNRVGIAYTNTRQYDKALFYYKKSLSVAEQYNDTASIINVTINISQELNQPKEVAALLLNTMKKYPIKDITSRIRLISNLLKAYTNTREYVLAQQYCDQLLALSNKISKQDAEQGFVYTAVIPFYLKTKQYRQARKYLVTFELFSKNLRLLKGTNAVLMNWFKLDSAQGNYLSAIRHYQQYKQFQDSIFNETRSRQLANLEVLYETEKKEQNLKLKEESIKALTREGLLQAERIKREQLIRNAIIGGAILLLLLLGVIYNRYRLKQRSNRLLEAKQQEINEKNYRLQQVLGEKEELILDKDKLLAEKELLITHQDHILVEKDDLLQEKQWLLKEIHHRVKNNLQIVMSLLSSQVAYLQDEKALLAIRESQNRIYAISLSHQKLYLSEKIALIEMAAYIKEITEYLQDSFQMHGRIRFELAVAPVELDGAVAVPLGLIINEAVTNALKYAFPGGRTGQVYISMSRIDQQNCLLTISDDGVGLGEGIDLTHTHSLGMGLMKGLSKQLGGSLTVETAGGLQIRVVFSSIPKGVSLKKSV